MKLPRHHPTPDHVTREVAKDLNHPGELFGLSEVDPLGLPLKKHSCADQIIIGLSDAVTVLSRVSRIVKVIPPRAIMERQLG